MGESQACAHTERQRARAGAAGAAETPAQQGMRRLVDFKRFVLRTGG